MITTATFKTRFPEFASVDDARIQLFIDDATNILNEAYWSVKYDLGLSYLAAHMLALGEKSSGGATGSNGLVASRSVDGASVSYTNATPENSGDAYYMSTTYGQRYIALRRTLQGAAIVI